MSSGIWGMLNVQNFEHMDLWFGFLLGKTFFIVSEGLMNTSLSL